MLLKLIVVFMAVLAAHAASLDPSRADGSVFSWTGTTSGAGVPTFRQPNSLSAQGCAMVTAPTTNYRVFNFTFANSGVRQVALLAESSFKSAVTVLLYQGIFNPGDSCSNYARTLINANFPDPTYGAGSLIVDDYFYFVAGTNYSLVVTSRVQSSTTTGIFGLRVEGSYAVGNTTTGFNWSPSTLDTGSCTLTPGVNQTASIFYYTHTSSTGYYDLYALFEANSTQYPATYLSIYEGSYNASQMQSACAFPLNGTLRISAHEGDRSAAGVAQYLQQFVDYTVVISSTNTGNWAFRVLPTRIQQVLNLNGYTQPNRELTCGTSSQTNAPWLTVSIPSAVGNYYILDTDHIPTYNSFYFGFSALAWAYNGTLSTNPFPSACPATSSLLAFSFTGNSSGPLTIPTTPGRAYTVVISSVDGGAIPPPPPPPPTPKYPGVFVYLFSADSNPPVPTTTGGLTSTTGPRNATTSTSSSTSTTTTSDATAIKLPVLFVVAGVLLHMLL